MQMTEREAIESTYFDRAAIYRRETVADTVTKQARQQEVLVADDLHCALSQIRSGALSLADGYGKTSGGYTLFCAPDAPVLAGDKLVIATGAGQSFTLWAGKPFVYVSHAEVPLAATEERA